jgi:hypothetical protein
MVPCPNCLNSGAGRAPLLQPDNGNWRCLTCGGSATDAELRELAAVSNRFSDNMRRRAQGDVPVELGFTTTRSYEDDTINFTARMKVTRLEMELATDLWPLLRSVAQKLASDLIVAAARETNRGRIARPAYVPMVMPSDVADSWTERLQRSYEGEPPVFPFDDDDDEENDLPPTGSPRSSTDVSVLPKRGARLIVFPPEGDQ